MAGLITFRRRLLVAALILVTGIGLLLLARDQPAGAASGTTVKLSAQKGQLKFNTTRLSARHGRVTLVMTNPRGSGIPHSVAVQGHGINKKGRTANPGRTSQVTVALKRGTYNFYCPIDGHRAAGMQGKLTVR